MATTTLNHPNIGDVGSNQGRRAVNGAKGVNTSRITITLTAEDLAVLDEIAQGNRSEGVRLAVRAWQRELADQVMEAQRIAAEMEEDPGSVVSHAELKRRLTEKKATLYAMAN